MARESLHAPHDVHMHRRILFAFTGILCAASFTPCDAGAQRDVVIEGDTVVSAPRAPTERRRPEGPLLDRPVSRSEYRLGPGDVLDVSIFGEINRQYPVFVSPEGTILIPTVGVATVLGLSLDEAQERVRAAVGRFYRNVDVRLTLAEVRTFKVFVVGDVDSPGVQEASSATRVSELVEPTSADGVARRSVLLRRANGDTTLVDLARFAQLGDLRANPTLREGDAVVVPRVDRSVQVFGRVAFPGTYEYREDDSLADLLEVANGGGRFMADAGDSIRIARYTGARRDFVVLSQAEAAGATGRAFRLAPDDAVFVPALANHRRQASATVLGQVRNPGTYPIRADTTTLSELVSMAGGLTSEAAAGRAVLRRRPEGLSRSAIEDLAHTPPELLSRPEQQILQIASQGNERNVVIDVHALQAGGDPRYDQRLQAGDTLLVPQHLNQITVLGAVRRPGIVQYVPGQRLEHVVQLAGGYTRQADARQAVVLNSTLGTRLHRSEVDAIEAGDMVIVPFRDRRNYLQTLQTNHAIVGTVTGLVFTFLALF
jgi:polysaccharide biosynthesis/export protein